MNVERTAKEKYRATVEILSDTEVLIARTFNAPRELVFEAITTPEHVKDWYGCDTMTMIVCEMDVRVGGKWRYRLRMPDGSEHGFYGEYREIVVPSRLVSTENYEPIGPGHEMLSMLTLEERNGRTIFRNRLSYQSKADRDGHLGSGMERGMNEALDRLDALVTRRRVEA
jgi:uncharacterized protein YndB with AHSA1/START domain